MQQALGKLIYQTAALIRGEPTFQYLKLYKQTQHEGDIRAYQEERLTEILRYATERISYYKQFKGETFGNIPPLTKKTLKEQGQALRNTAIKATSKTTGGSTGQPVSIYKSSEAMAREQAGTLRGYSWAGIQPGSRQARFWGTSSHTTRALQDSIKDFLLNRKRFSAFNYQTEDFQRFAKELKTFSPRYFYGYASILNDFALFAQQEGIRFESLRAIISTSEILTPEIRKHLEEAFGVKVFDEYGCGEVGTISHQCEKGSAHINAENLFVEILDDDNQPVIGKPGRIILTELHNRAQPLIRYEVGDYGVLSDEPCPCGRTLPVLNNVCGRAYDIIIGPEGRKYHPEFFIYIFEDIKRQGEAVEQFQVVQQERVLKLHVVEGKEFSAQTKDAIINPLRREFGEYFCYEVIPVDSIPREPSGKLRVVKRVD